LSALQGVANGLGNARTAGLTGALVAVPFVKGTLEERGLIQDETV